MKTILILLASAAAAFSLSACDLDDYDSGHRGGRGHHHGHHHGDGHGNGGHHGRH